MFVDKAKSRPKSGARKKVLHLGRLQPYLQTLDYARKACQEETWRTFINYSRKSLMRLWIVVLGTCNHNRTNLFCARTWVGSSHKYQAWTQVSDRIKRPSLSAARRDLLLEKVLLDCTMVSLKATLLFSPFLYFFLPININHINILYLIVRALSMEYPFTTPKLTDRQTHGWKDRRVGGQIGIGWQTDSWTDSWTDS
jgi:hypothetical protein